MTVLEQVLKLLGFKSLLKAPGRRFVDLTSDDVPSLLRSHLDGGNDDFDAAALTELLDAQSKAPQLREFIDDMEVIDREYSDEGKVNGLDTEAGLIALRRYLQTLERP